MSIRLDYSSLGNDGLAEIVEKALGDVVANIQDPNTDHKKVRKLKIEVAFKPDEQRTFPVMSYTVNSSLAPVKPVTVTSMLAPDTRTGEVILTIPEIGTRPDQNELPINNPKVTSIKEAQNG